MNPKRVYKYLVYTYKNEYKENLCFQGIFDTRERAEVYAEVLKKTGAYNNVSFTEVPYIGEGI